MEAIERQQILEQHINALTERVNTLQAHLKLQATKYQEALAEQAGQHQALQRALVSVVQVLANAQILPPAAFANEAVHWFEPHCEVQRRWLDCFQSLSAGSGLPPEQRRKLFHLVPKIADEAPPVPSE